MASFIPFYTDPARKGLQRLQIGVMILLVPLALFLGIPAYQDYRNFQEAGKLLMQADELSHEGKVKEALEACEKCVALYPGFYEAYELMASLNYSRSDRHLAIESYERGLKVLPEHGELHLGLAQMLFLEKRYPEAQEHARKATELLPGDPRPGHLVQSCDDLMKREKAEG